MRLINGVFCFSSAMVFGGVMIFYAGLAALGNYNFWESRIHKDLPASHPEEIASNNMR